MALAIRTSEPYWEPAEDTFLALVRELPDEYIVVDQGYSGAQKFTRDGGECCLEWDVLVLGPGMAALVHVATYGDFVSLEDRGQDYVLTYLDEDGRQQVHDTEEQRKRWPFMASVAQASPSLSLEDVIRAIAQAEEYVPEDMRHFFSQLSVGRATVLPYARREWDPAVAERMGCDRLYTIDQLTAWLREMSDSTVFEGREWGEAKVQALMGALGVDQGAWDGYWEGVAEQMQAQAVMERDTEAISDQALGEEVSQAFPFPLAYSFRVVYTAQEPRVEYLEKLRCAENFLAYLGSLGVALAQAAGLSLRPGGDLKVDLARCWSRGISAGRWVEITRETTRALRDLDDPEVAPIPEFSSLWWKPGRKSRQTDTAKRLEGLVQLRNDFHHYRRSKTPAEFEEAVEGIQHMLLDVLRDLRFLTRYPLWYVTDCEAQRRRSLFKVTYKLCMGDHPRFVQHEAQYDRSLPRRCVYLRSGERLLDLTPWIVLRACPTCGNEAMFFVEGVDKKKETVTYKSFERGHTDQCTEYWVDVARSLGPME